MKTPAGRECRFFYGDYHRGRQVEICRLLEGGTDLWQRSFCGTCPVPSILCANACPNLVLHGRVVRHNLFWKRVCVVALCRYTGSIVLQPKVGCGHCDELGRETVGPPNPQ